MFQKENKSYMKCFFFILGLTLIPYALLCQSINVQDLELIQSIKDLKKIEYFLKPKYFRYEGLYEKNTSAGLDIYRFINDNDIIEVGLSSSAHGIGLISEAISVTYYIYDRKSAEYFVKSLKINNYSLNQEGTFKNGDSYWVFFNSETLTTIGVRQKSDHLKVTVI